MAEDKEETNMNPLDWLAWLYGKLFVGHTILSYLLVFLLGGIIAITIWARAIDIYRNSHEALPATRLSNGVQPKTVEQLAIKLRSSALALGGSIFAESRLRACLWEEHAEQFYEVITALELQGFAERTKLKDPKPWWILH